MSAADPRPTLELCVVPGRFITSSFVVHACRAEKKCRRSLLRVAAERRITPREYRERGWPVALKMILADRNTTVGLLLGSESCLMGIQLGRRATAGPHCENSPGGGIRPKSPARPIGHAAVGQHSCRERVAKGLRERQPSHGLPGT